MSRFSDVSVDVKAVLFLNTLHQINIDSLLQSVTQLKTISCVYVCMYM